MSAKCSICGMESDRADWVGKTNVQCDSHTPEQLKAAKAATHQAHSPEPTHPPTPKEPPPPTPKEPAPKEPHKDPSKEPTKTEQPKKATASLY